MAAGKPGLNLDSIPSPPVVSSVPDKESEEETEFLEKEHRRLENVGLAQDISERKKYASRVFCLVLGWLFGVYLLLVLQGFKLAFHLSDSVLLAAIGSTTANIIAILVIVVRYLFPGKNQ